MNQSTIAPRHADLVKLIHVYLGDRGRSARWFGLQVADDARLVPNLARGQHYPADILVAAVERMLAFYEREAADLDSFCASQVIHPARQAVAA